MPRPIVEVLQTVATVQTTVTDPDQSTLIVGPKYDVVSYDASSGDNSASKLADEFNPYTGATDSAVGATVELDSRGAIDTDSIKVYLEDVIYEVGAPSPSSVTSAFDGSVKNLAAYAASISDWQQKVLHTGGSFADSTYTRKPKAGDTLQIAYPFANVFVPNSAEGFSADELSALRSSSYTASVTVASATITDAKVLNYKTTSAVHSSNYHVDLFEVFGEDDYGQVFSKLTGDEQELAIADGAPCTLKITDGDANTHTVAGTLNVPEPQQTSVTSVANDYSSLGTSDTLRQFVSAHLVNELQMISSRVEAPLSADFGVNGDSVFLPNADDDWSYSTVTRDLTFNNAITLRDTNLPNAASLADKVITRATIYVSSKSLDATQTNQILTVNASDYVSVLGEPTPDNPLSLAASIALQNSGTSTIKVLKISEDSSNGLLSALPIINANPDVYSILPLTQDVSVINSYAVAAVNQSAPGVGKFRIVLGSAESAPLWRYWAGTRANEYGWSASNVASGSITNDAKVADVAGTAVIVDAEGGFLGEGGPAVGDTVVLSFTATGESKFTCLVESIQSNSQITVDLGLSDALPAYENTDVYYTGAADIKDNRSAQVESLLGAIAPLTTNVDLAKRLVMVYPGEVSIGEYSQLPGYYLTAAIGGMLAAFEPHRPKNQIAISGLADIEYSNLGYFSDEQIDALSDGGYFVMIQETPGGLPFCVHQVTAAYRQYAGTQEYSELSVVNNFDYVSSVFKKSLEPYVGVWNVIPQAYSSIFASLDSAILSLKARSSDRIGAPLVSGDIVSVDPSEADQGTINVVMDIALPKVLNKIRLEVVSQ